MAEISKRLGREFYPWQRYVTDVLEEVDPATGGPWYEEVIFLVPRRSGKTVMIPPVTARVCGQPTTASVWMTAQKRDNARKRWLEASAFIMKGFPRQVRRKISHSFEELRWTKTDSLFVPFAPDEESMHGEEPTRVFLDELWALSQEEFELVEAGYSAAWSVMPGQAVLLSAAGTHRSTALKAARRRGRAATLDPDSRTAFFEWCIPETIGGKQASELAAEELLPVILANHPRAGRGLREDFVLGKLHKNKIDALRAFGGLDSDTSEAETVIDSNAWRRARDRSVRIPPSARVGIGVAVDGDWREAAVFTAWRGPDGVALLELIEVRDGTRWATRAARDLLERWPGSMVATASDAGGRDIGDTLAADGYGDHVLRVTTFDYAAACHRFITGIQNRSRPLVLHRGERALERAHRDAGQRKAGGGLVWEPTGERPVTSLPAGTLALWAADHLPAEPEPVRRFKVM